MRDYRRIVAFLQLIMLLGTTVSATENDTLTWQAIHHDKYTIYYTRSDKDKLQQLENNLASGYKLMGRSKFFGLLKHTQKHEVLKAINLTEEELISNWKKSH